MAALRDLRGLVVIDEVQRTPDLFPVLRVLIDRESRTGQYLLLGSASPNLLKQAGETLLGRVEVIEITGFNLDELGPEGLQGLWARGGYPLAYTRRPMPRACTGARRSSTASSKASCPYSA